LTDDEETGQSCHLKFHQPEYHFYLTRVYDYSKHVRLSSAQTETQETGNHIKYLKCIKVYNELIIKIVRYIYYLTNAAFI